MFDKADGENNNIMTRQRLIEEWAVTVGPESKESTTVRVAVKCIAGDGKCCFGCAYAGIELGWMELLLVLMQKRFLRLFHKFIEDNC